MPLIPYRSGRRLALAVLCLAVLFGLSKGSIRGKLVVEEGDTLPPYVGIMVPGTGLYRFEDVDSSGAFFVKYSPRGPYAVWAPLDDEFDSGTTHKFYGLDAKRDTVITLRVGAAFRADDARPQVFINQVGFDIGDDKIAIVQAKAESTTTGIFEVIDDVGYPVLVGDLQYRGEVTHWSERYWAADFSAIVDPGAYRVVADIGGDADTSAVFVVGADAIPAATLRLAYEFFHPQRCGTAVPGWHEACHLDDAQLPDGSQFDAAGGWHDAGDYGKYMLFQQLASWSLFEAYSRQPLFFDAIDVDGNQRADIIDEALWGVIWIFKMADLERGHFRGHVKSPNSWLPPSQETDNIPATGDERPLVDEPAWNYSGLALASLALAHIYESDLGYLAAAESLWTTHTQHRSGEQMLAAALALWQATGSDFYRQESDRLAAAVLGRQGTDGSFRGPMPVEEGQIPAILARYLTVFPDAAARSDILDGLRRWAAESLEATGITPMDVAPWASDGPVFFLPRPSDGGWHVGFNSRYLSKAWAYLLAGELLENPTLRQAAIRKFNWVLGANPFGICMFEGVGTTNPLTYHHRYSTIRDNGKLGRVPGTVCNGIVANDPWHDLPSFDVISGPGSSASYSSNEPWLPHNAFWLLASSALAPQGELTPEIVGVSSNRGTRTRISMSVRPNPANANAVVSVELPSAGMVVWKVFDITGQLVWQGPQKRLAAGGHSLVWAGVDEDGRRVGSGVFLIALRFGGHRWVRRVTVLR
ncbi:MAG: glycoside hydrolase family 9 protein [Candidatus Latescibacteria bacterium]|nr:glycoside hydrolase family 9 protein [Candidatus Latescibacterota bacterium]